MSLTAMSQGVWDDPFESTSRGFSNRAWTFNLGTESMLGSSWDSQWIVPREFDDVMVNDTLHSGRWESQSRPGVQVGAGLVWRRNKALWLDRVSAGIQLSRRRVDEQYTGLLKIMNDVGDSSVVPVEAPILHEGRAWFASFQLQSHSTLASGPDGYLEWLMGIRGGMHLSPSQTPVIDNLFTPLPLPQWHVAWTLGLGAGVKVWRGRILRLSVDADILQLAQAAQPEVTRTQDAGIDGLNWMQGAYRPWRVTLHHDLFQPKPEEGCAAPTRSKESKTLFDPKMKKAGKVKHKGYKRFLDSDD